MEGTKANKAKEKKLVWLQYCGLESGCVLTPSS